MAKDPENGSSPRNAITEQRIAAALFVARTGTVANPYALVNSFNLREEKKKKNKAYYDKNGYTMPASIEVLQMDAERKIRHSRQLASNMYKADRAQVKLLNMDTHHIVGRVHIEASTARAYLFTWGIGINDADNGVFLPRYAHTKIACMPNAQNHQGMHTYVYYFNVTMRLGEVAGQSVAAGRSVLRAIKGELIAGTFPIC